ncbi:MAG TPA: hypothetical protein VKZ67_00910 [Natronosporangium sp.]|nr:hypothetical protein [Natronosporangium sp.]
MADTDPSGRERAAAPETSLTPPPTVSAAVPAEALDEAEPSAELSGGDETGLLAEDGWLPA